MPRSSQEGIGNLPAELTSFVGRRSETSVVKRHLTRSRLVTLTGMGGVGKTRLALHVAAGLRQQYRHGIWLVRLDEVRDETLMPQTVAAALGLWDLRGRSPVPVLTEHLAERRTLLVLDNCEHLIDAAAKLAETLLAAAPDLRIVATSREALDIAGETVLVVPPLPTPDPDRPGAYHELARYPAITLFVQRAAATAPSFSLREADQAPVVEICHRLDGLPLAIELAAAWLPVLSPGQIRDRLRDRLRLLSRGRRGAPDRQQTLRACLAWSFDLCTRLEQRLWARLSVFVGGFTLETVESVCAFGDLAAGDMLGLVSSLLDKSVLVREPFPDAVQYRMLESVRAFGLDRLRETGEFATLRRRHRDWYEQMTTRGQQDWDSPRHQSWLDRLDRELPDLRAALEFSVMDAAEASAALRIGACLHSYWVARGMNEEGRHWLGRALAQPTGPSPERVRAAYTADILAAMQGDIDAARDWMRHARQTAAQLDDPLSHGIALLAGGAPELHSGNAAAAVPHVERALAVLQDHDDFWTLMALAGLAMLKAILGDTAGALLIHRRILAMTEPRGEVRLRSQSVWAVGVGLWMQGEPGRAAESVTQSLELRNKHRLSDTYGAALCLDVLAWVSAHDGRAERAATLLGAVAALSRTMGAPTGTYPGLLHHHQECERQAREALDEARFQAAFARGGRMTIEEATAFVIAGTAPGEEGGGGAPDDAEGPALTRRERQICELITEGLSNRQIADRLVISQRTAESHVQNSLMKLGFTNRSQVAAWMATRQRRP
ncbi:LuxR C-terminal-related transcriptional regulator [Actinoplanes sp. NEAU-A12]|uniref:LuxR C-terminal-related transcriptional regulator n=2 Tax=Actinoplanes sandaracinus TaxID=3045177 RepID=A0ABT6WSH9_9ACTN|nr:LuxR C-terminal-related transcriptional regulator [Actinoplanes sandaracinus]